MAAWHVAPSLQTLLGQVNAAAPRRSKVSDGGVGDVAHAKVGTSDHLPDRGGCVRARDFTHDPAGGFDAAAFADRLLAAQDPRLKYVISNARIGSGPAGPAPGRWRPYSGANPHRHHAHVSVVAGAAAGDPRPWAGAGTASTAKTHTAAARAAAREDTEMDAFRYLKGPVTPEIYVLDLTTGKRQHVTAATWKALVASGGPPPVHTVAQDVFDAIPKAEGSR